MSPHPWGILLFVLAVLHVDVECCGRSVTSPTTTREPGTPTTARTTTKAATTTTKTPTDCDKCDPNTIMLTMVEDGAKAFDTDNTAIDPDSGCLVRTLTCTGTMANVDVNGGGGALLDGGTGTVNVAATCNADGTTWNIMGVDVPVTQLECDAVPADLPACQKCAPVTTTKNGPMAKDFDTFSVAKNADMCNELTTLCTGMPDSVSVELNEPDFALGDNDVTTPGMVMLVFLCDDDGSYYMETPNLDPDKETKITNLECSAF